MATKRKLGSNKNIIGKVFGWLTVVAFAGTQDAAGSCAAGADRLLDTQSADPVSGISIKFGLFSIFRLKKEFYEPKITHL